MSQEVREVVEIVDRGTHLEARFLGKFSVRRFLSQLAEVIEAGQASGRKLVLLDATALEGPLSLVDRYEIGSQGARMAWGLRVAVLSSAELVDPRKMGVLVARNRGLDIELFLTQEEALSWLLTPRD